MRLVRCCIGNLYEFLQVSVCVCTCSSVCVCVCVCVPVISFIIYVCPLPLPSVIFCLSFALFRSFYCHLFLCVCVSSVCSSCVYLKFLFYFGNFLFSYSSVSFGYRPITSSKITSAYYTPFLE